MNEDTNLNEINRTLNKLVRVLERIADNSDTVIKYKEMKTNLVPSK